MGRVPGIIRGMPKVTIHIPDNEIDAIRAFTERYHGGNFSALVMKVIRDQMLRQAVINHEWRLASGLYPELVEARRLREKYVEERRAEWAARDAADTADAR